MSPTRREFLTYAGLGTYALLMDKQALDAKPATIGPRRRGPNPDWFRPINPSGEDRLILPEGYTSTILAKWNDPLGSRGPRGDERFGFNNDFLAYFPIDALTGGNNPNEGLLFVNHEYPNPLFVSRYTGRRKTAPQIELEKLCVGASVIQVARREGTWQHVPGTRYTRRLTALYPEIRMSGPASTVVPTGIGTLANCSGGRTPWFTALSCEENFHHYNDTSREGYSWVDVADQRIDERQYGWVVEVDPFGDLPPLKHTALGRFSHENCAWRLSVGNKLVIYMGDDAADQFFYKYVSRQTYNPRGTRADNRRLLSEGTLYVADFGAGRWKPLDWARNRDLQAAGFRDQADVLIRTREAAIAVRATPLDRPEDCEVHPLDGSVYIALTNNTRHGNFFGQIVRLIEQGDNPEAENFQFEIYLVGGPQSGLACPDNLMFDRAGNLWVVCDISSERLGQGAYRPFMNNGMFVVPTVGPNAGDAFQFASGPKDCELTGPWFNENEDTLFLAVQHPGEESNSLDPADLTSHWPEGGNAIPKPAIVAITGFRR